MKKSFSIALSLTAFIIICRWCKPLADFYSLHIYPVISFVLSWISAPFHFSVQTTAIFALIFVAILYVVLTAHKHTGWKKCLKREANLLLWTFVWFYMGWCVNYSRSSIYERLDISKEPCDSASFAEFLKDYTAGLNSSYVLDKDVSIASIEQEIKGFYAAVPKKYGLCQPQEWQHSKNMFPEGLFTSIGILGYMGPLFSEFHINGSLQPEELPFSWAHEYSHLLGVSNEDEANWWAWNACLNSDIPAIRYSAFQSMLGYVIDNASRSLPKDEFEEWIRSVDANVMADYKRQRDFWISRRNPALIKAQKKTYDLFLKGNNIPSGINNYSEVIRMLISIEPVNSHL